MTSKEIGVFEAKSHLSDLLRKVKEGESFILTNRGEPVAELRPIEGPKRPLTRGCAKNRDFWMSEDFDVPLEDFKDYM